MKKGEIHPQHTQATSQSVQEPSLSKRYQLISFWISNITSVAGFIIGVVGLIIGVIALNSIMEIKGVTELIETGKPIIRLVDLNSEVFEKTLVVQTNIKNFGVRPALNVKTNIVFDDDKGKPLLASARPIPEIAPGQQLPIGYTFDTTMFARQDFYKSKIIMKLIYTDAVSGKVDTSFTTGKMIHDKRGAVAFTYITDSIELSNLHVAYDSAKSQFKGEINE